MKSRTTRTYDLAAAPPPAAAVEIAAHHVVGATLEFRGGRPLVTAQAVEGLPAGALIPALTSQNVHDPGEVADAVARVLEQIGRPRRIGLVVPDAVARVSLLHFDQIPARAADLDQLIRWQVRKSAPFALEEAQVSHVPAGNGDFIVTLARTDTIREYEALCSAAGAQAGLVDIATFNVINAVLAGTIPPGSDWLLVNVASDVASIAIMRGSQLIFFRSRSADADGTLADLVHQSAMYYEDRLGGSGFDRALLAGASSAAHPAEIDGLRGSLEERLRISVERVDALGAASLTDRITASPSLADALTPAVGLLLRDREAAA
jgi:type IV pilus assembly protein PilM